MMGKDTTSESKKEAAPAQMLIDALAMVYACDATFFRILKTMGLLGVGVKDGKSTGLSSYLMALAPSAFGFCFSGLKFTFSLRYFCYYPLLTFLQSIAIGFEHKMSVGVGEQLERTGYVEGKSELEDSCLQAYHEVQEYIEKSPEAAKVRKGLAERFKECYDETAMCLKKSYEELMERSGKVAEHADAALSGDDFVFSPTENPFIVGKKLRELCSYDGWDKNTTGFWYKMLKLTDQVPAVFSATCSTFFIGIDQLGRYVGEMLASSTVNIFGKQKLFEGSSAKNIIRVDRALLSVLYVLHETYWIAGVLLFGAKGDTFKKIEAYLSTLFYETTYFPIATGVMMGLYEELAVNYPNDLAKFQENIQKNTPALRERATTSRSTLLTFKDCYEQARREYEKYDEPYKSYKKAATGESGKKTDEDMNEKEKRKQFFSGESKRMDRALAKNAPGAKRFLEGRRAFLWVLSSVSDKNKYFKNAVLALRAGTLFIQLLFSKALFLGTKNITRLFAHQAHSPMAKQAASWVMSAAASYHTKAAQVASRAASTAASYPTKAINSLFDLKTGLLSMIIPKRPISKLSKPTKTQVSEAKEPGISRSKDAD